jgi:hypothetical protein
MQNTSHAARFLNAEAFRAEPIQWQRGEGQLSASGLPIAAGQKCPHFSPFSPSLVEASGAHEWVSEVGERETTAECRVVGPIRWQQITKYADDDELMW